MSFEGNEEFIHAINTICVKGYIIPESVRIKMEQCARSRARRVAEYLNPDPMNLDVRSQI
jgi:hypothetical protein